MWNITLDYKADTHTFTLQDFGGHESRNASTIHLLLMALAQARGSIHRDFQANIVTEDYVADDVTTPHLSYCCGPDAEHAILIPDSMFWGWPEVGMPDYEKTADEILAAGEKPPEDARLFWIGNVATHRTRRVFMENFRNDRRVHALGMNWIHEGAQHGERLGSQDNVFVSLPDHCRYKYLIDLQGRGYSGRLKLLMFSGRPLFVQYRKWREYFFDDLEPFVHFIPVEEDLRDLGMMLDWAELHPGDVAAIAENARRYAVGHLRREHAVARFRDCLVQLAAL